MKKKLFWLLAAMVATLCLFTVSASAATVASGTCGANGNNVTWALDDAGRLTISGTGAMEDYDDYYSSRRAPWYSHNGNILQVTIGSGVTSIGEDAFYKCSSLLKVTIGDSVTSIGTYAFSGCSSLTSVTIPDSVTTIGDWAFYSCRNLTSVTIPDSVTSIGESAFSVCDSLTAVHYTGDVADWCSIKFGDPYANPLRAAKNLYIDGQLVTDLVIPDSVTSIGSSAFSGCTSLTSVTIPDSVTTIGDSAFYSCNRLTSVTIPNSVTTIGDYAFYECYNLTAVTIGDSVTTIGYSAFGCNLYYHSRLASVHYTGDVAGWCGIAFENFFANPLYYAKNLYIDGKLVTDLVIPQGISMVKGNAFCNATCLTSVELPLSLEAVGKDAFYGCTGITKVSYPGTGAQWAEILFGTGNEAITKYTPEHAHNWEDVAFIVAPTCHSAGTKTQKCTVCGTTEEAVAPATGKHKWDEGEIKKFPNIYEEGERFHTCTNTGCTATKTDILPKYLPGDLNGDGVVTTKDVTLLRRYIAGGYGVTLFGGV